MNTTTRSVSPSDYRALVEQAPMMIWRANANGLCDYFNERWLTFTGRPLERELGDGWASSVHAEDLERCLHTFRDAFARREVFEMEYRLRRYDGEYRWIVDRGAPVTDEGGAFLGYIGSCIDVHERVLAQQALVRRHAIELQMLRGLLPMCAWCRKIQDDNGEWMVIEAYISRHSDARVTHGLCPDCHRRVETNDA